MLFALKLFVVLCFILSMTLMFASNAAFTVFRLHVFFGLHSFCFLSFFSLLMVYHLFHVLDDLYSFDHCLYILYFSCDLFSIFKYHQVLATGYIGPLKWLYVAVLGP